MSDFQRDTTDGYLWLHIPTGKYYVRAYRTGKKPLFKNTGYTTSNKTKARTSALKLISEWMGDRKPTTDPHGFKDFAAEFLLYIRKTNLRPRTIEQAMFYVGELIDELGHKDLRDINEGMFDEWLADFKTRKKRETFADYAKYLSKIMRHAHRKGLINRLPKFNSHDKKKQTGRVFTRDEINDLLAVANFRLELQLRLCLQGFMRLREMLFLTWDRIDLQSGLITLRPDDVKTGSKTGVGRSFYVNQEIVSMLKTTKDKSLGSPWVFPSPTDKYKPTWSNKTAWIKAKRKAGITGKGRWHDLRHTAISWSLTEKQMNPLMVSRYAGVSIRTIERVYLKVTPEHTREIAACIDL